MIDLREDARRIVNEAIAGVLPNQAVEAALADRRFPGRVYLVAIGKAGFSMAQAAAKVLGPALVKGVVLTKYGHAQGLLERIEVVEAGHPVPDRNTLYGTEKVLALVEGLTATDTVLFLVSGGGSALFEKPLPGVDLTDLEKITQQLLACGADIVEINTIRKRLSAVKGGRFAHLCRPAQVFSVILSDVLGDRLDSIASGPAWPDAATVEDALTIVEKYKLSLPSSLLAKLKLETPKQVDNVTVMVTGSVKALCREAAAAAARLGYRPVILTTQLTCEAREGGRFLAAIAREIRDGGYLQPPCAVILGGETVVNVKGKGKGGRNQEFALAAAEGIAGLSDTVVIAAGSDGTDGPTDAAGGLVDGQTQEVLLRQGLKIGAVLEDNNAYCGLAACDGLLLTGPTGTNVNDVAVLLCC